MASTFGNAIRMTLFGQSHGQAVGVVLDGLPAGLPIDMEALQAFLCRRAPGKGVGASKRQETDVPRFISGLVEGKTCGAPICAVIENSDARPEAYTGAMDLPRPGHADYPAMAKHGQHADLRGGGHYSGRLTAPLCIAGGIAMQLLAQRGIHVGAHILSVGGIADSPFDQVSATEQTLHAPGEKAFPVIDAAAGKAMQALIAQVEAEKDSIGGVIECMALGLPAGLGSPIFDGVENHVAQAVFGIPAVRGIAFGDGFEASEMRGSAHNDPYAVEDGKIRTATNHHGGALGGMATGMPLRLRVAIKPTASIGLLQQTVRMSLMQPEAIAIEGRHDVCIVPRAVPCVEAAVAVALLDLLYMEGGQ